MRAKKAPKITRSRVQDGGPTFRNTPSARAQQLASVRSGCFRCVFRALSDRGKKMLKFKKRLGCPMMANNGGVMANSLSCDEVWET